MGRLLRAIGDRWYHEAEDWFYGPLRPDQAPDAVAHRPVAPNDSYISIWLRSMRIVNSRAGFDKLYGTVFSYSSLPHLSGDLAEFSYVDLPAELQKVDKAHLDRVIRANERLLGPVPYRGGDLKVEVGLFSVRSIDLAAPYLQVLKALADAATVAFVPLAAPFVAPLMQGVDLLIGGGGGSALEIGLFRTYSPPETGYLVVMAAPAGDVRAGDLLVQSDTYRLTDRSGNPIRQYAYMVLCVEASAQRSDWFMIPQLKAPYARLRDAVAGGSGRERTTALTVFEEAVRASPDLLSRDAEQLIARVRDQALRGAVPTAATQRWIPELDQIKLYG
jgi:hypothetical protein